MLKGITDQKPNNMKKTLLTLALAAGTLSLLATFTGVPGVASNEALSQGGNLRTATEPVTTTFDFANNEYGLERLSGNTTDYIDEGQTINYEGVTLKFTNKNSNPSNESGSRLWSGGIRMYNGGTIVVTAEGKITEMSVTTNSSSSFTVEGEGGTSTTSGSVITWTGETEELIISYTLTSSNKTVSAIAVTYQKNTDDTRENADLSFDKVAYSVPLTAGTFQATLNNPNNLPVTYESSDTDVATVDDNGVVTLKTAGKTTITASTEGNDSYKPGSAMYDLDVMTAVSNAAEFINTTGNVIADFTSYITYTNGRNTYILDEEGNAMLIYGDVENAEKGRVINPGWIARYSPYNGLDEVVPAETVATSDETCDVVYEVVEPSYLVTENMNKVVTVNNVEFTAATPAAVSNFTGTSEGTDIAFRNNFKLASVEAGNYDVDLVIAVYRDAIQVYPVAYRKVAEAPIASYNGEEIEDGGEISVSGLTKSVDVTFTCAEGSEGTIMYIFTPEGGNPSAVQEVPADGVVSFTESGVVTYYVVTADNQSEAKTIVITFAEKDAVTVTASYNDEVIVNESEVLTEAGALEAVITFSVEPEDAVIYYNYVPNDAEDEGNWQTVGEDGKVTFIEGGTISFYAQTENGVSETTVFTLVFLPRPVDAPLHIAAYYNDEILANDAVVTLPGTGEGVTVRFECDNQNATLYYNFTAEGETNKYVYKPVPEDGVVTFTELGTVNYYAATAEFACGAYTFTIEKSVGVDSINAADAKAVFYDLQGRRVNGTLKSGIYVMIQDGKATKVIVR